jgi:hypothetical protein
MYNFIIGHLKVRAHQTAFSIFSTMALANYMHEQLRARRQINECCGIVGYIGN